jgi:hypothetical protein
MLTRRQPSSGVAVCVTLSPGLAWALSVVTVPCVVEPMVTEEPSFAVLLRFERVKEAVALIAVPVSMTSRKKNFINFIIYDI